MDVDNIFTYDDVMIHIFKLLSFEDQVRLAVTSLRMKNVFETYIWPHKYTTLYIYPNEPYNYSAPMDEDPTVIITNETEVNRQWLSAEGLQEFLKCYAMEFQKLIFFKRYKIDLKLFTNLTKLRYVCDKENPVKDLQLIAENIRNLECLTLVWSYNKDIEYWDVDSFLKMTNLKRLVLKGGTMKYEGFLKIIIKLKLEYFKVQSHIELGWEIEKKNKPRILIDSIHLQELSIYFIARMWSKYLPLHLDNLLVLTLGVQGGNIPDAMLTIFAETCKNLEKLTFHNADFCRSKYFTLAPKVTDLTLKPCCLLNYEHLKHLLTETKITKFNSLDSGYRGELEGFILSPLIQKLAIQITVMRKIQFTPEACENLKELTVDYDEYYPQSDNPLGFKDIPLVSFINLETLDVQNRQIDLNILLQLKHLHHLSITCYDLPYIAALLNHPSLNELIIDCNTRRPMTMFELQPLEEDQTLECLQTNIKRLKIHYDIFQEMLNFWLNLYCCNAKLSLECYSFYCRDIDFLITLVNCKRFPKRLKTIDVFGFAIDCNDLRNNPDVTVEKYESVPDKLNRIILHGKQH